MPLGDDAEVFEEVLGDGFGRGARKATRTYGARNRGSSLSFPDSRGSQTWTYTADGLPATITTYNGLNNTDPVINAYAYNRRRQLAGESVSQPGL